MKGFVGQILYVNLTDDKYKVMPIEEKLARLFIGGSGLAAKILYDDTSVHTHPLGPENLLIFMTGPLTGTVPLSGRHQVVAKSPLTGIFGESDVGGSFGVELKRAGFDGVVVTGRADKPVYVWICDGDVEIKNAEYIWGFDSIEADQSLKRETDSKAVSSTIGQAGEKLVRFASVMTDGEHARAAARCGLGAVMGSKKLKAIVVRGTGNVEVADEPNLKKSIREITPTIVEKMKGLSDFGTSSGMVTIEKVGDLPIKNWTLGKFEQGAKKLSGQEMAKSLLTGRYYCATCIVGCGRVIKSSLVNWETAGPEYETLAMLGSMCLVDDLKAVAKANELCNRYGLDTISTGAVIAFAMEAYERKLIKPEETNNLELKWGSGEAVIQLIHMIARREGIGRILGEGVKRASEKIGSTASEFALHVKALELPAHDPRAYNSVGLSYATSNRGACHTQGLTHVFERSLTMPELGYTEIQDRFGISGKGEFVAKMQDLMCLLDSLKLCKFILFGGIKLQHMIEWLNLVTGRNITQKEFMKAGERIFNLKRMYNVRCGITRKDDTLPNRILTLRRREGGAGQNLPPLGEMLSQYYEYRCWDEFGIPKKEKLIELELS